MYLKIDRDKRELINICEKNHRGIEIDYILSIFDKNQSKDGNTDCLII